MKLKFNSRIKFMICTMMLSLTFLNINAIAESQKIDQIVAIVNNDIITQSQFDEAIKRTREGIKKSHMQFPNEQAFKRFILNHLIDQKMQMEIAKQTGIKANKKEIDATIERIAKRNKLTLDQLKQKIHQEGYTFKNFRKEIAQQATISQLQQQALAKDITVNQSDIDQFIQRSKKQQANAAQYHITNILIPVSDDSSKTQIKEAKQKAHETLGKLHKGANFNRIAEYFAGANLGWKNFVE